MKRNRTMFVAAVAAALMVSVAGWSVLQPSTAAPVAPAAADQTLGMALMGARVFVDGTLSEGSGVTSSSRYSTGSYLVTFERKIRTGCFYSTTVLGQAHVVIRIPVISDYQFQFSAHNASTGALQDAAFSLIVFCPK